MLLSKPDSYEKKGKLQASTSHKQNIGKNNLAMCIERILNHEQAGLILRIHHWFNIKKKKKSVGMDFPDDPVVGNPPANAGDMGSIPGLGRFHMPLGN